jgi:hypothetical protein
VRASRALFFRGLAVVAISSCTLLFAEPGVAGAAHTVVHPESFRFEAQLPSSDGYSLYLRGYGHRKIELDLGSESSEKPYTTMTYTTTGRVDRHGIEADFGQFGLVDLRFAGSPKRSIFPFPNCNAGKPEVNQYGAMRGRVEFESLGGVVQLETGRVEEGQTWHAPKRTCTPKPSHVSYGGPEVAKRIGQREAESGSFVKTFVARAHLMARTIDLYATKIQGEVIDMAATSTRRFGPVLVSTSVHAPEGEAAAPGKAVELSIVGSGPRPRGAGLSAAAPFSGSATYRKRPGTAPSWLGSLAVEMPGEGTLPLAGPGFHAILCAYSSHKRERACERTVAPPHLVG